VRLNLLGWTDRRLLCEVESSPARRRCTTVYQMQRRQTKKEDSTPTTTKQKKSAVMPCAQSRRGSLPGSVKDRHGPDPQSLSVTPETDGRVLPQGPRGNSRLLQQRVNNFRERR
jgi:hypothetical protein